MSLAELLFVAIVLGTATLAWWSEGHHKLWFRRKLNAKALNISIQKIVEQYGLYAVLVALSKYCKFAQQRHRDQFPESRYYGWFNVATKLEELAKYAKEEGFENQVPLTTPHLIACESCSRQWIDIPVSDDQAYCPWCKTLCTVRGEISEDIVEMLKEKGTKDLRDKKKK